MNPDIRRFNFYTSRNHFYGSQSGLSFHIAPGEEEFTVEIWDEPVCCALAQNKETFTFPFTEDGLHQIENWLGEQIALRRK
jgi:hypothetical protein